MPKENRNEHSLFIRFEKSDRLWIRKTSKERFLKDSNFVQWLVNAYRHGRLIDRQQIPVVNDFEGPGKPEAVHEVMPREAKESYDGARQRSA